jgi:hypothetical protein
MALTRCAADAGAWCRRHPWGPAYGFRFNAIRSIARAARQRKDRVLAEEIRAVNGESGGAYGSPRITVDLREKGRRVNEKRIARIMRTTVPSRALTALSTRPACHCRAPP